MFIPQKKLLPLFLSPMLAFASLGQAQTVDLVTDSFSGDGNLNGRSPGITVSNETVAASKWVANSGTMTVGGRLSMTGTQTNSVDLLQVSYFGGNAAVYTLSASATRPAGSSTTNLWGIGFASAPVTSSTPLNTASGGKPWIALRHDGHVLVYTGGNVLLGQTVSPVAAGQHTLVLKLDTTQPQWKLNASVNGTAIDLNGTAAGTTYLFPTRSWSIRHVFVASAAPSETTTLDNFRLTKSYPVLPADRLVDSIGIGTKVNFAPAVDTVANLVQDLGIRHARAWITTDPGTKSRLARLKQNGVRFSFVLDKYDVHNTDELRLSALRTYRSHLKMALPAADGGGTLLESTEFIEGPNEPNKVDGTFKDGYMHFITNLPQIFREDSATRNLSIAGPSLTCNADTAGMTAAHTVLGDLTGNIVIDGVSYPKWNYGNSHCYPGGNVPKTRLTEEQDLWQMNIRFKPIIVTESGYHNLLNTTTPHNPTSELATSIYLPRMYLEYLQQGILRTYVYQLADDPASQSGNRLYGLVREDFTSKKPSYHAVKNLISIMQDPGTPFTPTQISVAISGATDVSALLFQKRNLKYYLAVWRNRRVWEHIIKPRQDLTVSPVPITVTLPSNRTSAKLYRPTDSPTGVTLSGPSVNFSVDGQVHILEF